MSITDPQPLAGRHAVVTGGGRGIGLACAEVLGKLGARLTLMGRTQATLEAAAARLGASFQVCDVAKPEQIEAAFRAAGPAHILVNNAGVARSAPFGKMDLAFWNEIMAVDLTGAALCMQQAVKGMQAEGWGRIVNVASVAGLTGLAYCTAYCAAKHGLIGLTRALAKELAKSPITVNAVCPGYTETDIVEDAIANIIAKTGRSREEALAGLVAGNPQGRLIQPSEIAETVAWLCLPSSGSVTGQSIVVAGGELM